MLISMILLSSITYCASQSSPTSANADVSYWIDRLDQNPDLLHVDYTPVVHRLIEIGAPALAPALDLMISADEMTRLRAQRVIEGVILVERGFVFGSGWSRGDARANDAAFREFWHTLGNLQYERPLDERRHAVELWREWLDSRRQVVR